MANVLVQPYLFFGGRCEEAIDFYGKTLGAEVDMIMLFKDSPEPLPSGMLQPSFENKVMHSAFRIGGNIIMASDGCTEGSSFAGFRLSLAFATIDEAANVFSAMCDGGKIDMPLAKTFWSPSYGMVTDRFGVGWMVSVPGN